jgi:hypothetical protein
MAQKGGTLNPGADPTLVQAAYAAAMANVPKDLSGTYEALAKSYGDTMKSVSESWSESIKTVANLGAPLIKQAIRNQFAPIAMEGHMYDRPAVSVDTDVEQRGHEGYWKYKDSDRIYHTDKGKTEFFEDPDSYYKHRKEKGLPKDFTTDLKTVDRIKLEPISMADKFREIRKELRGLGLKQDKASKIRRHELKTARTHLYNNLEYLENIDNFTNDNLAKGLVDLEASGEMALLMQNALAAFKTKSGVIPPGQKGLEEFAGYHVTLAADENDDFNFILRNKSGEIVTGQDLDGNILTEKGGKPYLIAMNDLADNLIPKTDQKVLDTLAKGYNKLLTSNAPTFGQSGHRNWMAGFVRDEASLFGIMQHALGSSKTSWIEDLNSESVESATIFAGMGKAKLEKMGIDEMADKKKGYSASDFIGEDGSINTKNYKIVKDALLNRKSGNYEFKTTQRMFLDYSDRIGEDMHKFKNPTYTNLTGYKKSGNYVINNQHHSVDIVNPTIDALNTGEDYKATLLPFTNKWEYSRRKNGEYQLLPMDGGKDDWETFNSPQDIAKKLGIQPTLITYTVGDDTGENPFAGSKPNILRALPKAFVNAVDEDEDNIIDYLTDMNVLGLEMERIKGNDAFRLRYAGGKWKKFQADPKFGGTEDRAFEIWKWLWKNYKPPIKT